MLSVILAVEAAARRLNSCYTNQASQQATQAITKLQKPYKKTASQAVFFVQAYPSTKFGNSGQS